MKDEDTFVTHCIKPNKDGEFRLPSYGAFKCCGSGCPYDKENEPCWGDVDVVGEEYSEDDGYCWIHACKGHADIGAGWSDARYIPSDKPEDQI